MEIWEPKPPGTLWATPGLLRDCFFKFNSADSTEVDASDSAVCLRFGSAAAARLLELRIRISPGPWMTVCCECFVL